MYLNVYMYVGLAVYHISVYQAMGTHLYVCVRMYECMYLSMYNYNTLMNLRVCTVCIYICMYVSMYEPTIMYLCQQDLGICMYVCMYVCVQMEHPERVTELVLRGIFLVREKELQWLYQGCMELIFVLCI